MVCFAFPQFTHFIIIVVGKIIQYNITEIKISYYYMLIVVKDVNSPT